MPDFVRFSFVPRNAWTASIFHEASKLLQEDQERVEVMERTMNKIITKKDRKAVLFDYHGVRRINAETIVERPGEMRILKGVITKCADPKNFRVTGSFCDNELSPECLDSVTAHLAPHGVSMPWGAREDGMLCIGIVRHGYGAWAWAQIPLCISLEPELLLEDAPTVEYI